VSLDRIKHEVASLSREDQDKLIAYAIQLRHASDADYRREVTQRLNDQDKSDWLTPEDFERRF
jgi:hypothetical protein